MISVEELARALEGTARGDTAILLSGVAEPAKAGPTEAALAMQPAYAAQIRDGRARVAILWPGADWQAMGLAAAIEATRPRLLLAGVSHAFERRAEIAPGVHPTAFVDPSAVIGAGVAVGPFAFVGARSVIGDGTRIHSHASVAEDARIGRDALLHSGVRIGPRVRIGERFIAQPGAVVGADGFSYVTRRPGVVEEARETGAITSDEVQPYVRINSLGSVVIGDDVEVGANSCIDRGTVADTMIGDGTKIDNLVQVGHNVRIGRHCQLCGQAGVAGSTVVGDGTVLSGRSAVADHLRVGSNSVVTGNTGVSSHVGDKRIMAGYPAVRMDQWVEMYKALRRLPRVLARLEKGVFKPGSSD